VTGWLGLIIVVLAGCGLALAAAGLGGHTKRDTAAGRARASSSPARPGGSVLLESGSARPTEATPAARNRESVSLPRRYQVTLNVLLTNGWTVQ
jgi:hypothetical protein